MHSPACHLCADAEAGLSELSEHFPLEVDLVDIRSERGMQLMQAHRAPMSPLVLVDGGFFSSGRLPRKKLRKLLERRAAGLAAAPAGPDGQAGCRG